MTPREKEALDFIKSFINENGYSPSYVEIANQLGLNAKSGIHRIVTSLENQGHIMRSHKKRSMVLVKDPWQQVREAAAQLLESIKSEKIDDNGNGTVTVDAEALGNLDVALSEARALNQATTS